MRTGTRSKVRIKAIQSKSILNRSGITDYTVNCYSGCEHGCLYCYARFATRFSHPEDPWGSFVDIKINAAQVLQRQVKRKRVGRVFLSSVCDGWQPLEEKYGLTRQCLEILLEYGFPVTILTKSALAGRDLDLLVGKENVDFGVTLTTLDERLSRLVEPGTSTPGERLAVLAEARNRGIRTYALVGPLLPHLSDTEESLSSVLNSLRQIGVDYVYVDRLNPRYGVWPCLKGLLRERCPQLAVEYRQILFRKPVRKEYSLTLAKKVRKLAGQMGLAEKMALLF